MIVMDDDVISDVMSVSGVHAEYDIIFSYTIYIYLSLFTTKIERITTL